VLTVKVCSIVHYQVASQCQRGNIFIIVAAPLLKLCGR